MDFGHSCTTHHIHSCIAVSYIDVTFSLQSEIITLHFRNDFWQRWTDLSQTSKSCTLTTALCTVGHRAVKILIRQQVHCSKARCESHLVRYVRYFFPIMYSRYAYVIPEGNVRSHLAPISTSICIHVPSVVVLVPVLKESLRTKFKSWSWSLYESPCVCPCGGMIKRLKKFVNCFVLKSSKHCCFGIILHFVWLQKSCVLSVAIHICRY